MRNIYLFVNNAHSIYVYYVYTHLSKVQYERVRSSILNHQLLNLRAGIPNLPNPTSNIFVGLGDPQNLTRLLLFCPPSNGRTVQSISCFLFFPPSLPRPVQFTSSWSNRPGGRFAVPRGRQKHRRGYGTARTFLPLVLQEFPTQVGAV